MMAPRQSREGMPPSILLTIRVRFLSGRKIYAPAARKSKITEEIYNMSAKQETNEQQIMETYKKSNYLIRGSHNNTLNENRLLALAFYTIGPNNLEIDKDGLLRQKIPAKLIQKYIHNSGGAFYHALEDIAAGLTSLKIAYSDGKSFDYRVVIIRATYSDGYFWIHWSPYVKDYLVNMKGNYTMLDVKTMLGFKSVFSFRLYELLRAECYGNDTGVYAISYPLAELRFKLGTVVVDEKKLQKMIIWNRHKEPYYETALRIAKEVKFERWTNFKQRVLDTAVSEINEKSDLTVTYDISDTGMERIVHFTIKYIPAVKGIPCDDDKSQDNSINEELYAKYLDCLGQQDADLLCKGSGWKEDELADAMDIYEHNKDTVRDPAAFIAKALKNHWHYGNNDKTKSAPQTEEERRAEAEEKLYKVFSKYL